MQLLAIRDKDITALRRVFSLFPSVREVRVFGSRLQPHARRTADIDLAISAPEANASEWLELREALENIPIIHELDVVRTDRTLNARLLEKIAAEGVIIYSHDPSPAAEA